MSKHIKRTSFPSRGILPLTFILRMSMRRTLILRSGRSAHPRFTEQEACASSTHGTQTATPSAS